MRTLTTRQPAAPTRPRPGTMESDKRRALCFRLCFAFSCFAFCVRFVSSSSPAVASHSRAAAAAAYHLTSPPLISLCVFSLRSSLFSPLASSFQSSLVSLASRARRFVSSLSRRDRVIASARAAGGGDADNVYTYVCVCVSVRVYVSR